MGGRLRPGSGVLSYGQPCVVQPLAGTIGRVDRRRLIDEDPLQFRSVLAPNEPHRAGIAARVAARAAVKKPSLTFPFASGLMGGRVAAGLP
jgi:hypothetical protein